MNELRSLLSTNQSDRLKKEKAAQDRIDDPKLPRHTVYQGDRKIQQLGQDAIENGVIINNQSVAIGDVMLPLAKGNVLRRVDHTNGGALLGTAYRDALENDYDANGNRGETELGRNGGQEPSDSNNPNKPRKPSDRVPPPFGCVPPPSQCFWSSSPDTPDGFQAHGDAVVNENAQPVYLYCVPGTSVPANLGCDFLNQKWSCSAGVCSLDPNGSYSSQAECQAALLPPLITGGQCNFAYVIVYKRVGTDGTRYFGLRNATNNTLSSFGFTDINDAIADARSGTNNDVYKVTGITNITPRFDLFPARYFITTIFERPLGVASGLVDAQFTGNNGFPTYSPYTWSMEGVFPLNPANVDNCGNPPARCP